ncbi:MAG: superoxide dismutase family protein [Clostridia bacterium]|nr:superoxide dismutase family protein [Clostridia bacterium]
MHKRPLHPAAIAHIRGGDDAPTLAGTVRFYQFGHSVLVVTDLQGLPENDSGFFALHIHEGGSCNFGSVDAPFPDTGMHYNPYGEEHPRHAGDLPPLLRAGDGAYSAVLTDRFTVRDVIGRTVVVHGNGDDLHTQPSGGAGTKIACGVILPYNSARSSPFRNLR